MARRGNKRWAIHHGYMVLPRSRSSHQQTPPILLGLAEDDIGYKIFGLETWALVPNTELILLSGRSNRCHPWASGLG